MLWAFLFCETLLAFYAPSFTAQALWSGELNAVQLERIRSLNPGDPLPLFCGYLGTALLGFAILYSAARRIPALARFATKNFFFDLHILGGVMGPLFIVLHTTFSFSRTSSFSFIALSAFWTMILVVISGMLGRYVSPAMKMAGNRGTGTIGLANAWRRVHVTFTFLLLLITSVHVWVAFRFLF